jgi:hypothetical protein
MGPNVSYVMDQRPVGHGLVRSMMPTSLQSRWDDGSSTLVAKHTASTRMGERYAIYADSHRED